MHPRELDDALIDAKADLVVAKDARMLGAKREAEDALLWFKKTLGFKLFSYRAR